MKYFKHIIIFVIVLTVTISGVFLIKNFLQAQEGTPLPEFSKISRSASTNDEENLVKYFFFKGVGEKDIIGMRVYKNPEHLSVWDWYQENVPNPASNPQILSVDEYEALRDGRTIYVGVENIKKNLLNVDGTIKEAEKNKPIEYYLDPYIYLMSYSEGANSDTIEIFNRMIKNWKLNSNVFFSPEQKQAFKNDIKRWNDAKKIRTLLENYNGTHGGYPQLKAGTYVANHTISTWPSWQYELGKELGSFLPIDPMNKLGPCSGFDPLTCWNKETKKYAGEIKNEILQSVSNSNVYTYSALENGQKYFLGYETKFGKICEIEQCFNNSSSICVKVGTCKEQQYCQLGDWVNHCGKGGVNCGEECEIEGSRNYCESVYGEHQWYKEKIQNCSDDCKWETITYNQNDCDGYCGDGNLQINYGEECENNFITPTSAQAINETNQYKCLKCKITGGYCGDKILQTNYEQCDDGNEIDTDHCNNICENKNTNPIVNLEGSKTGRVGAPVNIVAIASDPDGDEMTYLWEIVSVPENSVAILSNTNTLNISFSPDKVGEYKLKLIAKDNYNGQGLDEIKIISQTYCGDGQVQEAKSSHEGITEECDGQDGLINYQCIGSGSVQCNSFCKVQCSDNGTLAKCGTGNAKLSGEVSNEMLANKISGASIEIKDSKDKLIKTTLSNSDGKYSFENLTKSFSLTGTLCGYKMIVSKNGFQTGSLDLFAFNQNLEKNFDLIPEGLKAGTKIILKWGATPIDLDAHLNFEINNEIVDINYGDKNLYYGVSFATENKNGEKQEIITINSFVENATYKYYIHNYSGTTAFSSAPIVQIVDAYSNVLYEFSPSLPLTNFTEYWHVFNIDGSKGNITEKNNIQEENPTN